MRMRRDMCPPRLWSAHGTPVRQAPAPLGAVLGASASEAELVAHEAGDLAAVGAPARLAHDVADDDPDRLHVARAQALGDVGGGVEGGLDRRVERVLAADGAQALGLDDGGRVAAL